jgi:hypothetical protein
LQWYANRESFLAQKADIIIYTPVEKEACPNNLAPTSSTTVQLVAVMPLRFAFWSAGVLPGRIMQGSIPVDHWEKTLHEGI